VKSWQESRLGWTGHADLPGSGPADESSRGVAAHRHQDGDGRWDSRAVFGELGSLF
jgi:hypothetical protein